MKQGPGLQSSLGLTVRSWLSGTNDLAHSVIERPYIPINIIATKWGTIWMLLKKDKSNFLLKSSFHGLILCLILLSSISIANLAELSCRFWVFYSCILLYMSY